MCVCVFEGVISGEKERLQPILALLLLHKANRKKTGFRCSLEKSVMCFPDTYGKLFGFPDFISSPFFYKVFSSSCLLEIERRRNIG